VAKIAVFVDHDIIIRHFVLSRALETLSHEHDVLFVFPDNHKRVRSDLSTLPVKRFRTLAVSDGRMYLYRCLYRSSVLKNMRGTRNQRIVFNFWRGVVGWRHFWLDWVWSWPLTYELYKAVTLARLGENKALNDLLQEERPDVVVHPTVLEGLFVSDLVRWGEANGKPTVFIMNAWDNPSVKAMTVGYPDRLVVWGEQSRQHAIHYMGVPADKIACLGAAQFDLYRRPPKMSPTEYRRRLGVPDQWKILLYAGSSKGLNEVRHLVALEQAIGQEKIKNCVVLYRPHPWRAYPEDEADFYSLNWKHVMMDPAMEACYRQSRQKGRIFVELANYEDTHVTLSVVDAVISPLSTILLEAAMHGKPVAAYLPDEDMTSDSFLFTVANMAHFKDFFERVDCIKCERPDDLVRDCERLLRLSDDPGISGRLQKQCAYFVEPSEHPYADRLNGLIHALLSSRSRPTVQEA
jgi:hypothetical protein